MTEPRSPRDPGRVSAPDAHGASLLIAVAVATIGCGAAAVYWRSGTAVWAAVIAGAFVFGPVALFVALRWRKEGRETRRRLRKLEDDAQAVERDRQGFEARVVALRAKEARADEQYRMLCELVQTRGRKPALREENHSGREEVEHALQSALSEIRWHEEANEELSDRIAELEVARLEAEDALRRVMSENRARIEAERSPSSSAGDRSDVGGVENGGASTPAAAGIDAKPLQAFPGQTEDRPRRAEGEAKAILARGETELDSLPTRTRMEEGEGPILSEHTVPALVLLSEPEPAGVLGSVGVTVTEMFRRLAQRRQDRRRA